MSLHALFGKHTADLTVSRWDQGLFVSRCTSCGAGMIKPPGLPWQLRKNGVL
jgi:exosome complex RNA-binding protein Csl4